MGVMIHGIHFHCGSSIHGSDAFSNALKLANKCMKLGKAMGHPMEILDLGGGFPMGDLTKTHKFIITKTKDRNYKVIAEPGRYFSSLSSILATRVLGRRHKHEKFCYHLNDSVYHTFNVVIMDAVNWNNKNQLYGSFNSQGERIDPGPLHPSNLLGMTCDGLDIITEDYMTPDLQVGDWLVFGGMGSYSIGPKSRFNGMVASERVEKVNFVMIDERLEKEKQEKIHQVTEMQKKPKKHKEEKTEN